MATPETSLIVKVLISGALLSTLIAWCLSVRYSRQTRALIAYLTQHQQEFWNALPRPARMFHPVGGVERYYRSAGPIDAAFETLYLARKKWARVQLLFILAAMALIALVILGTTYLGWHW